MEKEPLSRELVLQAYERIKNDVRLTPVLTSKTLDGLANAQLFFKCENFQRAGVFKVRGAFHALSCLTDAQVANGVITHSSGNHAAALALAAKERGVKCWVIMPKISMPNKIAATKSHGAEIVFSGSTSEEREALTALVQRHSGAHLVPPYDAPEIMAGQGTVGLELQKQQELDAVIAPLGGGGLLSGIALSYQGTGTLVFGAEPSFEGANDAERGLADGKRIDSVKSLTIADGLRTPVGEWPWAVISKVVEGVYSVSEDEIKEAMRLIMERMKIVVEPSSAVPLAVVLYNKRFQEHVRRLKGDNPKIGIVLSGGNTSMEAISKLFPKKEKSQPQT